MIDGLLKNQIRGDPDMAGMLTSFRGKPAFFYQKAPPDTDKGWSDKNQSCSPMQPGWKKPAFPRADYSIDMRYDPERKVSGTMIINVWCIRESAVTPEDIERRLVELISGTFYSTRREATVCAVWTRSEGFGFEMPANIGGNTSPEVFGVTLMFDLTEFPEQETTDPDPVQGLNGWTKGNFPDVKIINVDPGSSPGQALPEIWKPTDESPAVYWRFEGTAANDRQSYAVNWYTGQFAAHVIAETVPERNRWIKAMKEAMQLDGEVVLTDGSPMFVKNIAARNGADPLREGQLLLTGQYGVLAQHRKERAQIPLNNAVFPHGTISYKKGGIAHG